MKKQTKTVTLITAVFTVLCAAVVLLMMFWDKLTPIAVAGKERIDAILKSLLPEKPEKDDMSDYDDI